MFNNAKRFLKQGIQTANKNISLYIPLLLLYVFSNVFIFLNIQNNASLVFIFIAFLISLITISYNFSLWNFLNSRIEKKSLPLKQIINKVVNTLLRLLGGGIVLVIILIPIVFAVIFIVETVFGRGSFLKLTYLHMLLVFNLITPLFLYTRIYFAIKNLFFVKAIIKSVQFSLKHLKMTYLILPYTLTFALINIFVVVPFQSTLVDILYNLLISYTGFIIMATYLHYYRSIESLNTRKG